MGLRDVNTGQLGVSGSGDTVNAGGVKIESDFIEIYRAFGDRRLTDYKVGTSSNELYIRPHACGYHQVPNISNISNELQAGIKYDIDTQEYTDTELSLYLPKIIKSYSNSPDGNYARRGDVIIISDSANSWNQFNIILNAYSGQKISRRDSIRLSSHSTVTLTVVQTDSEELEWAIRYDTISGYKSGALIDSTYNFENAVRQDIKIGKVQDFNLVKLILFCDEYSPVTQSVINVSCSEILMLNTGDMTRYAVNETNPIYELDTFIDDDVVYMKVIPKTGNKVQFSIKSIGVIKTRSTERVPVYRRLNIHYGSGGRVQIATSIDWNSRVFTQNTYEFGWYTRYVFNQLNVRYKSGGVVDSKLNFGWVNRDEENQQLNINYTVDG